MSALSPLEERLREEFFIKQLSGPEEHGFIKRDHVRLWAMGFFRPKKSMFSLTPKAPYFTGFWVESRTVERALRKAFDSLDDYPAIVSLHIVNYPNDKPVAAGSAFGDGRYGIFHCPGLVKLPKGEPPRAVKLTFTAIIGVIAMIFLSLLWPRELFRFSWLLSIAGIGMFLAWKRWGDSEAVGRVLNFFRPAKRVNIIEEWCPSSGDPLAERVSRLTM